MNKQQLKQLRKDLDYSHDRMGKELGLNGKHRGRHIRRLEDLEHPVKPSKKLVKRAEILLAVHNLKLKLMEQEND